MSYPSQQYNEPFFNQQGDRSLFNNNNNDGDPFRSLFGRANHWMSDMMRSSSGTGGITSFMSTDSNDPNVKVFGVSSMNVTQISRGSDGRPHVVQAQDERRMGPGGVWQTKKALRDSDRGIDRMQVGYFIGDRGEIIERQLDPKSGQYRQETKRRGIPSNEQNFANQWKIQAQQTMQGPPGSFQQQLPSYQQFPQQALPPASSNHQYY